jgi:formimidoylglutamate deiminase
MTRSFLLKKVFLADGWATDVLLTLDDGGVIREIHKATPAGGAHVAETVHGIVVPGMPNGHSHAFQRAMAGDTEYRLSARDSFWTWRQSMYTLANRLEPEDLSVIALQVYVEMLKAGYTSVAEFHYLHNRRDGSRYANENALWDAVAVAAQRAGIALTLLPTLYQTSDFGNQPLRADQQRFHHQTDEFLRAVERRLLEDQRHRGTPRRTGVAFHSLRAVPLEQLHKAVTALRAMDGTLPLHIHIAEQTLEVDACRRETGMRPLELLLQTGLVDQHWCLVHATHATPQEIKAIADSKATVCVSITTEGNLGDGFFDAARFLKRGGRLCVGSDSQSSVNPAEELRWLEYQQRLRKRKRGVLASAQESHVGTVLWSGAAKHGGLALGQATGSLAVGSRADWLVLDAQHPSLAGGNTDTMLDRLLFAGGDRAIRDVMVAGRWVIRDGAHDEDDTLRAEFGGLLRRLATA